MNAFSHIHESFLKRLASDLDPKYTYHNVDHTKQVIRQVAHLAKYSGIAGRSLDLLRLAALFHDSGYLESPFDHEKTGCAIAREELKNEGISSEELESICNLIMATKVPQKPLDEMGRVMADADLYYLGTDRYYFYADKLLHELKMTKPNFHEQEWRHNQIAFLRNHRFHTEFGKRELEPVKIMHLKKLENEKY